MDYLGWTNVTVRFLFRRQKVRERRRQHDDRSKDWSGVADGQGMPAASRSWKSQGQILWGLQKKPGLATL